MNTEETKTPFVLTVEVAQDGNIRLVKSVVGGLEERADRKMALKRSLSIKRKLYWEQVSNEAKQTN